VELSKLLEAHPLALSLVGSLVKQEGWTYTLKRVQSHRLRLEALSTSASATRQASVQVALELSYEALPEALQARFRQLGVFPYGNDFASVMVGGLWELGGDGADLEELIAQAADILRDLHNRALLVLTLQQGEKKRFRLHSLLHDYTRGQLREMGEWERVRRQFVDVYTYVAHWFGQDFARFPGLMDVEWANLTAAFEIALGQEWYMEAALQLSYLVPYLISAGWLEEIDRRYERLEPYLDELPSGVRGQLAHSQVQRYLAAGDWRTAQQFNARVLADEEITADVRAFALYNEGVIRTAAGDAEGAKAYFDQALEAGAEVDSRSIRAQYLVARANGLRAEGDMDAALACWVDLANESADNANNVYAAYALNEAATLSLEMGRSDLARELLERAIGFAYLGESRMLEYEVVSRYGELLLALGSDPEDVESTGLRALTLLEEMALGERETGVRRAIALQLLARAAQRMGKFDEALAQAQEAVELIERYHPDPQLLALGWSLVSQLYVPLGKMDEAFVALREMERLLSEGVSDGEVQVAGD
jgi:tetratricopeptide (TPR) repeat protein